MVINIHKKGTRSKCENYRGITLLPTAYKLFANIIKKHTKCTFGRRNGRGTVWLQKGTQLYRYYIQGAADNLKKKRTQLTAVFVIYRLWKGIHEQRQAVGSDEQQNSKLLTKYNKMYLQEYES